MSMGVMVLNYNFKIVGNTYPFLVLFKLVKDYLPQVR